MSQPKITHKTPMVYHDPRRLRTVLVVEGITAPQSRMLSVQEFCRIKIDDKTYQRMKNVALINDLIHVLKNDGAIYDPVTVCERPNGDWYMVDGQQRFCAAYECSTPIPMLLYKSTGAEAEAQLYTAMNTRVTLNGNNQVKAHRGPSAALLRDLAQKPDSPYFNQIHFGDPGQRPYGASLLMRGMVAAMTNTVPNGAIARIMARADHALHIDKEAPRLSDLYLRLLPLVFPVSGIFRFLPALALGRVSYERFSCNASFPSPKVYERMKRINWQSIKGQGVKYLPIHEQEIRDIWRS